MRSAVRPFAVALALGLGYPVAGVASPVDLCVYEWEGYISPFAADFESYAKQRGSDVRLVFPKDAAAKPLYISSADDIFEMVRSGGCDVVTPTNNYFQDSGAKLLKVLAPIDMDAVPNFAGVVDNLKKATYAVAGDKRYAVPLLGGGYSLAYNADRVVEPPTSWTALADPLHKGRTSITGAQYEANVYVAAILEGTPPAKVYDWDSIDPDRVTERLRAMAGNVKAYWDSNPDIDLMANDLDLITDYGFGVAFANAKGQHWKFAQTKEPTTVWLDNVALTPRALETPDKSKAAHLLLNFMLSPEIQARLATMYQVVVPVPAAAEHVPADQRASVRVGSNDFYKEELMWQPLDKRTRNGFKALWTKATEGTP